MYQHLRVCSWQKWKSSRSFLASQAKSSLLTLSKIEEKWLKYHWQACTCSMCYFAGRTTHGIIATPLDFFRTRYKFEAQQAFYGGAYDHLEIEILWSEIMMFNKRGARKYIEELWMGLSSFAALNRLGRVDSGLINESSTPTEMRRQVLMAWLVCESTFTSDWTSRWKDCILLVIWQAGLPSSTQQSFSYSSAFSASSNFLFCCILLRSPRSLC